MMMRIALAQIDCRLGNFPANIATFRENLSQAQERGGADLVVFPELALTGYRLRSDTHRAMLDDRQFADAWGQIFAGDIVPPETYSAFGYVELTDRAEIHNTVALVRADQPAPVFRHRKVYLPTYGMFEEQRYMRPGDRFRVTEITTQAGETWRVGILCCEDAWHGSAWSILQARGADLIIVPSASPGRGVESERLGSQRSWYGILSTYAELTGCWVAYCNRIGFEDDIHFWGGSAIFSPDGLLVTQGPILEKDLLIHDLDKRAIATARILTPLSADENWDLTIRELQDAQRVRVGD
ncbi:MAG: nitrilase-related carbon-nitrogen hydrolase [Armatimonadota bacterium]